MTSEGKSRSSSKCSLRIETRRDDPAPPPEQDSPLGSKFIKPSISITQQYQKANVLAHLLPASKIGILFASATWILQPVAWLQIRSGSWISHEHAHLLSQGQHELAGG